MYFVKYGREYLHDPRIDGRMLLDLKLDCEENSCGFCDFTIYPDHPMYDKLKEHDADNPIEVYDDNVMLFAGFIYELGKEFYLDGHVKCKGDLDYLNDSIVRPYSTVQKGYGLHASNTVSSYFEWLIRQHNDQAAPSKEFVVGVNQGNSLNNAALIFEESIEYPTVMEEIKKNLLDVYGGYLSVRHEDGKRYIDYLSERRDANTQILDFGVNLTDYTQTDDSSEVATFVIPLGAKMSETEYEYDDGYFQTTDTSVDIEKEYYTENNDGYSRCEELTAFVAGTTYYESDDNGYFVTADTTCDAEKQYYVRNTEITGYSKCNELEFFKTNVTYYEYDENEDESELLLTIDSGENLNSSYAGYIRSGDILYSQDGISKYGWIGMSYKNTELTTREELIDAGAIALKEKVSPKRTIEIKAVDMHLVNPSVKPIRIGEYVRVRSKPHKLDSYFLCASIDLDMNNPENSLYTLGTTFDTLTGQQNKRINELNSSIQKQFERAETIVLNQALEESSNAERLASGAYSQAVNAANSAIAARNAADAATARVELVESTVTTVQEDTLAATQAAGQAQQEASAAITAAGQASAIANQINTEITDVKGDAESLRDAIEGQIESKVTTMTANYVSTTDLTTTTTTLQTEITESAAGVETRVEQTYAKKTDLTSAETDIWTELRQNSSSIGSVASEVTTVQADVTTAQAAATTAKNLANAAQQSADAAGTNAIAAQQAAAAAQAAADQAQADVNALESTTTTRITSVEQTSNGIATRVTSAETTISNLQSSVSSQFLEVEETAEGITARVGTVETDLSHLTFGGRNLYLETRNFSSSRWNNLEYWTEVTPQTLEYVEYGRLGSWMGLNQSVNVVAEETYTFSFYAKGDAEALVHVYLDYDGTSTNPEYVVIGSVSTGNYMRYSATFTASITGTINPRVENTTDSQLYICALKFERGNRPTDWTPAPEDAENAIVDAKKCATDYINFSADGLTVGDMTAETLGKNVNISGTGIKLRTGSTTMAEFTPTVIDFEQPVVFKADGIMLDNGDAYSYLGRNSILWSHATGKWMTDSIALSTNITRQLSGAVFAWCYFQNGAAQDTNWRYFFVPKAHITNHPGAGIYMTDPYLGMNKYIYVSNSNVTGVASNSQSGTTNGLAWNNANYVLRYVIGV